LINAAPQGFVEGHLKIISPKEVELTDETPSKMTSKKYVDYPLVILNRDKKTEVTHVTADKSGNYRVTLPPGAYILAVQERSGEERAAERIHANPQPLTVVSNETVRVDITVFIGPAKGQASACIFYRLVRIG
jgi:hypothetical protein